MTMIEIRVGEHDFSNGLAFWIRRLNEPKDNAQEPPLVLKRFEWRKLGPDEIRGEPIYFDHRKVQTLMDDLWDCGVRPAEWHRAQDDVAHLLRKLSADLIAEMRIEVDLDDVSEGSEELDDDESADSNDAWEGLDARIVDLERSVATLKREVKGLHPFPIGLLG